MGGTPSRAVPGALFTDDDLDLLALVLHGERLDQRRVLFRQGTRLSGVRILQTAWVALLATSDAGSRSRMSRT